jgi:hypothetical protein
MNVRACMVLYHSDSYSTEALERLKACLTISQKLLGFHRDDKVKLLMAFKTS